MSFDEDENEPPRKRIRAKNETEKNIKTNDRRLFAPFRALGFVTNHVPFAMQVRSYKGASGPPRVHIVSCVGTSWLEFEGEKMKLLFVGPENEQPITSMTMEGNHIWITTGFDIVCYEAGSELFRIKSPLKSHLNSILVLGSQVMALTADGRHLLVWDSSRRELITTIIFEEGFTATSVIHPVTLLNKVLVSSKQGTMQLWNVRTNACIYSFKASTLLPDRTKTSAITSLVQSHVADIVGIGFASGVVSVHDIRADDQIMHVMMDGGAISSIAFRTDGHEVLATANTTGHIALWDLAQKGRLIYIIKGAHDGIVTALQWVPGQPLLISSGTDNSIKQWVFDSPDLPPRLLKSRGGHHSPPQLITYYGSDGKQLLTAAQDRSLRYTSVVRDSRSFELSQGSLSKKAKSLALPTESLKIPPVTCLSFSTARSKDWDDVLTGHVDESFARTWSVTNKRLGKYSLFTTAKGREANLSPRGVVRAVHVTACGNFGLAASSTGTIYMWNLQSGIKRKEFELGPAPDEVDHRFRAVESGGVKGAKGRSVTGLAVDALNQTVIATTLDGTINYFNFHTKELEETLVVPSSITSLSLQRESNLFAVICDDAIVRLFDLETKRLVREFSGFHGRVLDITFSHDSRWLIATSMDSIIRTFDIPSGNLIDAFRTQTIATAISFSPTGDFLATAHVDSVGIYLWANRAQFAEVSWRAAADIEAEIADSIQLPTVQGTMDDETLDALTELGIIDSTQTSSYPSSLLAGELITLTLLPRARWQTLLNLDVITLRNKPKEPPKAPEKAPFFLPSLPGEALHFDIGKSGTNFDAEKSNKPTNRLEKDRALAAERTQNDYDDVFTLLKTLSPPAVELELRLLITVRQQTQFINVLITRLLSHRDFEMVQTLLAVFVKLHGESLIENEEMREDMQRL
ncbi:U3 small nucleolar RNA-associated protein 21 homolog Short=U3 snoRNA-associated protein 21 [Serendipita indica DSM 11827]|nr:U3 small nucleolar RNA-associated protein 21 homolog Short=U3 snoRNA-associated protein 21 [Serendipita indica DSM 11827]